MHNNNSHFIELMRDLFKAKRLEYKKSQVNMKIEIDKPSHFDSDPLDIKFKTLINLNPKIRQDARVFILDMQNKIKNEVFTKEDEEKNIVKQRTLNVFTLYEQLLKKNITLSIAEGQNESNLALVGLIKTFTNFKLKTKTFKIEPGSKFWINSI